MSFLTPLFLLGAAAVVFPVLWHLIRREVRQKFTFSSTMFLQPSLPRLTRRSRLEQWLLLLVRCLVLILLALAFARPYLPAKGLPAAPSESRRRTLVLLDNSASMRRENLWPAALAEAKKALSDLKATDSGAFYLFHEELQPVMAFEEWNNLQAQERASVAFSRVQPTNLSWRATHLDAALLNAVDLLLEQMRASSEAAPVNQIIVVSDFQEGTKLDGLHGFNWPASIRVELRPVEGKKRSNAGLQSVAESDASANPHSARIRVANAKGSKLSEFKVGWQTQAGEFTPALEVHVPPGQSRIFQIPRPPERRLTELVLQGDDHAFDNRLFLGHSETEKGLILYFGEEDAEQKDGLFFYLKRAMGQAAGRDFQPQTVPAEPSAEAESEVCLGVVTGPLTAAQLKLASSLAEKGIPLLCVLRSTHSVQGLGQLLGLDSLTANEATVTGYSMLGNIAFEHPLFAPFADPRFSDFTKIHIWKHRVLDAGQFAEAKILVRFDSGAPAMLEVKRGEGSVFVLTTSWAPADSQLALSSKFVPLLFSLMELNGSLGSARNWRQIGDLFQAPEGEPMRVHGPAGTERSLAAGSSFRFEQPGLYRFAGPGPEIAICANLAPGESQTAPMSMEEIEQLGVPTRSAEPEKKRDQLAAAAATAMELEGRQKHWRSLVWLALILVIFETGLAAVRSRPSTQEGS